MFLHAIIAVFLAFCGVRADIMPLQVNNNTLTFSLLPGISNCLSLQFVGILADGSGSGNAAYQLSLQIGQQRLKTNTTQLNRVAYVYSTALSTPNLAIVFPTVSSNTLVVNINTPLTYPIYVKAQVDSKLSLDFGSSYIVQMLTKSVDLQVANGNSLLMLSSCNFNHNFYVSSDADLISSVVFPPNNNNQYFLLQNPAIVNVATDSDSTKFNITVPYNLTWQNIGNARYVFNQTSVVQYLKDGLFFTNLVFSPNQASISAHSAFSYKAYYAEDPNVLKEYIDCGFISDGSAVGIVNGLMPNVVQNMSFGGDEAMFGAIVATDTKAGLFLTYDYFPIQSSENGDQYPQFTSWTMKIVVIVFSCLLFLGCVANVTMIAIIKKQI